MRRCGSWGGKGHLTTTNYNLIMSASRRLKRSEAKLDCILQSHGVVASNEMHAPYFNNSPEIIRHSVKEAVRRNFNFT